MINNIATTAMDLRPKLEAAKAQPSLSSFSMPPILNFKAALQKKEKALIRVKKITKNDKIVIAGTIDDDYVDIIEEEIEQNPTTNFFSSSTFTPPDFALKQIYKRKIKYLKNCYIIDYIQSPQVRCGMGTEAIKQLAEKAMFDKKAEGRIVTFASPVAKESSPAIFFYKLGFRFTSPIANQYIEECISKHIPDIPAQTGIMYLPKNRIHKLLRYGELF